MRLAAVRIVFAALMAAVPHHAAAQQPECTLSPTEIYETVSGNIVQVISFSIDPHRVLDRVRPGTGSGIEISPGLILTNYHVVRGGRLIGVSSDDWSFEAELIGGDPVLDIALLRIPVAGREVTLPGFGSYGDLVVGQRAYVVGYPLGIGRTLSEGVISGLDRQIPLNTLSWTTRYIQTDAAVSPGNSGGALLDGCGRIIGMVSMRSSHPQAENLGYALPMDSIRPLLAEIEAKGRVSRPWHGLYGQMMTPLIASLLGWNPFFVPDGFLVETVEPGSAADKAGLRGGIVPVHWGLIEILVGGDVITEVNDQPITTLAEALTAVGSLQIGDTVRLKVWRDGEELELEATLEERPNFDSDVAISSQP